MRVIAGQLGGRLFESPGGHATHPMSDKIRGALFNVLGDIKHFWMLLRVRVQLDLKPLVGVLRVLSWLSLIKPPTLQSSQTSLHWA
jgi:hypothetical protein